MEHIIGAICYQSLPVRHLLNMYNMERPKTTNSAVFVRCLAPRDLPIGVDAVRRIIRDAYQRIGLTHGRSNELCHTLSCQLLDHSSSLKEVADVLRHRSMTFLSDCVNRLNLNSRGTDQKFCQRQHLMLFYIYGVLVAQFFFQAAPTRLGKSGFPRLSS